MCFVTKKAHQKAIAELELKIAQAEASRESEIDMVLGVINSLRTPGLLDQHPLWAEIEANKTKIAVVEENQLAWEHTITDHVVSYHPEAIPQPTPDYFDPKAEVYPEELGGMKLGFVRAKLTSSGKFPHLVMVLPDNSLDAYENPEWGTNADARRVLVNPSRLAVAVESPPDLPEYKTKLYRNNGKPFAWIFDSGSVAYRVCPKQIINGHDLSELPKLYIRLQDVL